MGLLTARKLQLLIKNSSGRYAVAVFNTTAGRPSEWLHCMRIGQTRTRASMSRQKYLQSHKRSAELRFRPLLLIQGGDASMDFLL